jgi:uncharacterized protein (TIGR03382 family)
MTAPASKSLRTVTGILCLVMLAACGGEYPETGASTAAIVNGTLDLQHPTVGLLHWTTNGQRGTCTATLVGNHTLVTAAHCVSEVGATDFHFALNGETYVVRSTTPHPEASTSGTSVQHDVAVVTLVADALIDLGTAEPIPLANVGAVSGTRLEVVGMGQTEDPEDRGGSKRTTTNIVGRLDAWSYSLTAPNVAAGNLGSFCKGDSGGPSFATVQGKTVQVGIHSFLAGEDEEGLCSKAEGYDFRIDPYLSWIEGAAMGDVVRAHLGALPAGALPTSTSGSEIGDSTRNEFQAVACNATGSGPAPAAGLIVLALAGLTWRRRFRQASATAA